MTANRTDRASVLDNRQKGFLLIVENDSHTLSYLVTLLQRFNYPPFKATTGWEALEIAKTAVPFLIITDLQLPDMHGFDLIQQLKQHPSTAHVPLLAVNRQNDLEARKRCLELGAVGCIYHPVEAEMLYRVVQVAVEKNPRMYMRTRMVHPVKVNDGRHNSFYGAYTLDLSERGLFLRTMNPASINSQLSLQLDVSGRIIPAEAEVLYSCNADGGPYQEPGIGLKFTRINSEDTEHIRQCIRDEVTRGIVPEQA